MKKLPRQIKKIPFELPLGMKPPACPALVLEDIYHIPGQSAAIRFFDTHSHGDFYAMRDIMKVKHVKKWMDYVGAFTKEDYLDWAGTHSIDHYLFAVLDARQSSLKEISYVRGFVYFYSEREEKFRIRRLERLGYLKPAAPYRHCLEVSFALRPPKPGMHTGSGLIASAVRQGCLQVKTLLSEVGKSEVELFAFVDQANIPAQRTMESSGFVDRGLLKYDPDSEDESVFYVLDWRILTQKLQQKLLEMR